VLLLQDIELALSIMSTEFWPPPRKKWQVLRLLVLCLHTDSWLKALLCHPDNSACVLAYLGLNPYVTCSKDCIAVILSNKKDQNHLAHFSFA